MIIKNVAAIHIFVLFISGNPLLCGLVYFAEGVCRHKKTKKDFADNIRKER